MLHRARCLLLARAAGVLSLALAFSPPAIHAASAPAGMFNLGDWAWPTTATLDREAAAGVRSWRVALDFAVVGRTAGTYDWGGVDGFVLDLARHRMRPLFVVKGCPQRLCARAPVPLAGEARTEWRAFLRAAAARYGGSGTLWRANPTVVATPIRYWQIMNEVNGAAEWPKPSAADYAGFLVTSSNTLKGADRRALVVLAGLPEKMTVWLGDYLPALYAWPGFKDAVDVIAVHGYAPDPAATAKVLDTARAVMLRNDDAATPLWVTEFAWATSGLPGDPFVVTDATQAAYLRDAGDLMVGCAARWNLQRAYWYGWRDKTAPAVGYWGYHVGLHRLDGTAKPALSAFDEFTRAAPLPGDRAATCPLPGGTTFDITVPETTIVRGPGVRTPDPRPAYVFTSTETPARFECSMDGAGWATCTPDATGVWRPATNLGDGTHTLRVRAVDEFGNADATPASNTTIYDRYPPDTFIAGAWGNVASPNVTLTFTSGEPVRRFECRMDTAVWSACKSPLSVTLPAGAHTIDVRAIDLAGWADPQPAQAWYQVPAI